MNNHFRLLPLVAGLILLAGYHFGSAQQPPTAPKSAFHPGLGDLLAAEHAWEAKET